MTGYIGGYLLTYLYQKIERKIYIIKNVFYFAEKLDPKVKGQPTNFIVKSELGSRYKILRASMWQLITCRGGTFIKQISEGHRKLRMRMDICKFLEEQKFCKVAISGLLTPAQLKFCEKQAKQVVRHGNTRSTYSSEEE